MMLTKYDDFKRHSPLEGLVPSPLLPSPAVVLIVIPDHTVVVQAGVEVQSRVGARIEVRSSLKIDGKTF